MQSGKNQKAQRKKRSGKFDRADESSGSESNDSVQYPPQRTYKEIN